MIVLLDTNQDLATCATELECETGQLLTPLTRYLLREPDRHWAIDNGAFSSFDARAFMALLKREEHHRDQCRFVTVPDVVGSARRTLEVFSHWSPKLEGWPLALACQDGQENHAIPWDAIVAIFIGGSTNWKVGPSSVACIKAAQAIGKWVHVGRVNNPARFEFFNDLGVDSIDGTGIARYTHMREAIAKRYNQGSLLCAT